MPLRRAPERRDFLDRMRGARTWILEDLDRATFSEAGIWSARVADRHASRRFVPGRRRLEPQRRIGRRGGRGGQGREGGGGRAGRGGRGGRSGQKGGGGGLGGGGGGGGRHGRQQRGQRRRQRRRG